jgi:hypothetical protein
MRPVQGQIALLTQPSASKSFPNRGLALGMKIDEYRLCFSHRLIGLMHRVASSLDLSWLHAFRHSLSMSGKSPSDSLRTDRHQRLIHRSTVDDLQSYGSLHASGELTSGRELSDNGLGSDKLDAVQSKGFQQVWVVRRKLLRRGVFKRKGFEDRPVLKRLPISGAIKDASETQVGLPRGKLRESPRLGPFK